LEKAGIFNVLFSLDAVFSYWLIWADFNMDNLSKITGLQTVTMQRKNQATTLCSKMQIESLQPVSCCVKLALNNAFLTAEDKIF